MLKIYNSLTKRKEPFQPIHENRVNMYVCGPTVYDDIHIGNGRPVVFFDMLKRYLISLGYDVIYASNITDVDDKIINKAKESNRTEKEIATKYANEFFRISEKIGSLKPDITPYATNYIEEMITYIGELIEMGYAYVTNSGIYFSVSKIDDYGILSGQKIEDLRSNVRIENEDDKIDNADFALWKFTEEGIKFDTPWGKGRPGWHTECAVMNHVLFQDELDIHGGGFDLKFPHHENEIAQAKAHDGHHLAKYWMHVGRLDFGQEKMSKSLGNIIKVKDLLEKYDAGAYRLMIFAHHYRNPIEFSYTLMDQYQKTYDKISYTLNKWQFMFQLKGLDVKTDIKILEDEFNEIMYDDINTPNVITLIEKYVKELNKNQDLAYLRMIEKILNILGVEPKVNVPTRDDLDMYLKWEEARNQKDFKRADEIRSYLSEKGWI
ncbi:MAG TPA: cysteine--tRNA ligase [Acholeplasma sp.]|nr:cysteine--tRNA ligase [Acholeplasma sp.]